MNHLLQPSFIMSRGRALVSRAVRAPMILAAFAALTLLLTSSPSEMATLMSPAVAVVWRIAVFTVSIVLEAGPFVLTGAIMAQLARRWMHGRAIALPVFFAALAPGCDCSMNGFASALRRCPPPLAGAALTWGAACNPVALAATWFVLGRHVFFARLLGTAIAVSALWLSWHFAHFDDADHDRPCVHQDARGIVAHFERGLRLLLPAALLGSALIVARIGIHAHSALAAGVFAALLSPCSAADAVLAKVFGASRAAQAAFVMAAQCVDVRQVLLIRSHFGVRRALLAACAGIAGCALAAFAAR